MILIILTLVKYFFIANFIVSAVLVLHFYYLDYRTVTTLLTNVALCWTKVMTGTNLAKESLENEKAISYYNTKFVFFNNIDTEYKKTEVINLIEENPENINENVNTIIENIDIIVEKKELELKENNIIIEDNKTEIIDEKV